jgi:MFS family permease
MLSGIRMDKRQLLALCVCTGIVIFSGSTTVDLFPVYALQLGSDAGTAGLLVSVAFLGVTLGNITGGWLCDRFGRQKPFLLLSCVAWIPTLLAMTQATDIRWLIVLTGISWFPGGIALAALNIITGLSTTAGDSSGEVKVEGDRGKVFGWTAVASGVGGLVAGVVAGRVADRWGFPTLFVVMAATVGVMLAIALTIEDKRTGQSESHRPTERSAPPAAQSVSFVLILFLIAHLLWRLSQSIGGLGTPLAMTNLGFDATAVSNTFAISAAITLPLPLVMGWMSDKAGRKRFLIGCYAISSLGLFLLAPAEVLWQFWLANCLMAIAASANGVGQAYVADLTPPEAMGRSMSLFSTAGLAAGILGSGGAGYLMQSFGLTATLLFGACLPLLSIGIVLLIRKPAAVMAVVIVPQAEG